MSVLWIVPQFLVFGVSEMFTTMGLIEFYKQACADSMQAFLMALTYCSYVFGFNLSSVLVSLVNRVTARHGGRGQQCHFLALAECALACQLDLTCHVGKCDKNKRRADCVSAILKMLFE
jgi:dipeptide/tripeptide permease